MNFFSNNSTIFIYKYVFAIKISKLANKFFGRIFSNMFKQLMYDINTYGLLT